MLNRDEHAAAVLASLAWIVEFCLEHPEWFGELDATGGAEHEWLENAKKLVGEKM